MKTIIVGYDGSDQGRDALDLAAALVRSGGHRLIVASAIEFGPEAAYVPPGHLGYDQARRTHYEQVFARARERLGDLEHEDVELQDTAAHGLQELAEQEHADLIVLGSTHHGAFGRVLAGTVASRLLHGAPCAVIVAPRGWSEREHPPIRLIGVGYDGSAEAKLALAASVQLAGALGAGLRLITIAPYIGLEGGFAPPEGGPDWAKILSHAAESVPDEIEVERTLRQGREATELALQGVDLDLLVVGSRGYGPLRSTVLGSVAAELVRTAPCPVLVVPRGLEARGV